MIHWKMSDDKTSPLEFILSDYNISNEQFLDTMGISANTLRSYNNKKNNYSAENVPLGFINKVCSTFNKTIDQLIEFTEDYTGMKYEGIPEYCSDITTIRKSYIEAFTFIENNSTQGMKEFSKHVFNTIRKPFLTFIGTKESDKTQFLRKLFANDRLNGNNLEYFISRDDVPDSLKTYNRVGFKLKKDETLDIFALDSREYFESLTAIYEPSYDEDFSGEYAFVNILDSDFLKNCIVLSIPDLKYRTHEKSNESREMHFLDNDTALQFLRHERKSDLVVCFETISNFFTVERTPIFQYLCKRLEDNNDTLFIASKADLYPLPPDTNLASKIKKDGDLSFLEDKISPKNTEVQARFYKGPFSFDFTYVDMKKTLEAIQPLYSDFRNSDSLFDVFSNFFKNYSESLMDSASYIMIKEKPEIMKLLQSMMNDGQNFSIKQSNNDNSDEIRNGLKDLLDINKLNKLTENKQIDDIKSMLELIQKTVDIYKNKVDKIPLLSQNISVIQFILHNLLIPYFLLEGSFKAGNTTTWITKMKQEIGKFSDSPDFARYIQLINSSSRK